MKRAERESTSMTDTNPLLDEITDAALKEAAQTLDDNGMLDRQNLIHLKYKQDTGEDVVAYAKSYVTMVHNARTDPNSRR